MSRFKRILISILPGIFLIGYNVGTGSITSMSKAGANFGLDLLWTVLISCLVTYYLIILFSRYTMVTGETFIRGVKEHIHPLMAIFLITALSIIIFAALMGLMGILANVMHTWSQTVWSQDTSPLLWAMVISVFVYILLLLGNYSFFEKVLAILVAVMGVAFLATMLIDFPPITELMSGFVPKLPRVAAGSDNGSMVIMAGMVGTTVSVFAFIIRSQIVKETGWTMVDSKIQKRDALVSAQ